MLQQCSLGIHVHRARCYTVAVVVAVSVLVSGIRGRLRADVPLPSTTTTAIVDGRRRQHDLLARHVHRRVVEDESKEKAMDAVRAHAIQVPERERATRFALSNAGLESVDSPATAPERLDRMGRLITLHSLEVQVHTTTDHLLTSASVGSSHLFPLRGVGSRR